MAGILSGKDIQDTSISAIKLVDTYTKFENLPQEIQFPADGAQVTFTATDVQVHSKKGVLVGQTYEESDEDITIPSANASFAGAYPALHYSRVDTLTTTLATKADLVNGIVPSTQLPAVQRTIIRGVATGLDTSTTPATATGFNDENGNPVTPDENVQYFGQQSNLTFLYNTNNNLFVAINGGGVQLGETSLTAFRGDRGLVAYTHSQTTGNPHNTTKSDIGLGNVDNTSDINKPISTATQSVLNTKQTLISGTNIKTVGGITLLGSGDIVLPNSYFLQQAIYVPSTTINIPTGSSNGVNIFTTPVTKGGNCKVTFSGIFIATASAVLAVLTSAACFARISVIFLVGTTEVWRETIAIPRTGSGTAMQVTSVFSVGTGQNVVIRVEATDAGISLPANNTNKLIIES